MSKNEAVKALEKLRYVVSTNIIFIMTYVVLLFMELFHRPLAADGRGGHDRNVAGATYHRAAAHGRDGYDRGVAGYARGAAVDGRYASADGRDRRYAAADGRDRIPAPAPATAPTRAPAPSDWAPPPKPAPAPAPTLAPAPSDYGPTQYLMVLLLLLAELLLAIVMQLRMWS